MFVGEAPGQSEDVKGEPFVGAAGKFLDELLSEIGLSRKDVFITNVVKCRPPRNRPPDPGEIAVCTTYLDRQVEIIKPCFIVTLGNHSTAYVFSKTGLVFGGITQVHGRFHRITLHGMQVTVFPTFHPASALYNPKYREMLHADFRLLKNKMCKQPLL
jgi:DNA polymerase